MQLKISKIALEDSKSMTVRWLALESGDYFTTNDAAVLLAVTAEGIRSIIRDNQLLTVRPAHAQIEFLKTRKIIHAKDNHSNLIPRDTIDALVKIINTNEAKTIWKQMCAALRDPKEFVKLHHEMHGDAGVEKIKSAAEDMLSITAAQMSQLQEAIVKKLTELGLPTFDDYFCSTLDKWRNGTIHCIRIFIVKMLVPSKGPLDYKYSGKDLFRCNLINQGNFQKVMDFVANFRADEEQTKLFNYAITNYRLHPPGKSKEERKAAAARAKAYLAKLSEKSLTN